MEAVESALKCAECKAILESPVLLPCSDSVCKKHIKPDAKEFHCLVCDLIHAIPADGFLDNKALAILLTAKIQKAKFTPEYTNAYSSFKNLEKIVTDLKQFQKDPYFFINKTIGELKRETDIIRDEFKMSIDQKAELIIRELDKYEHECKSNLESGDVSNKLERIGKNIETIKSELGKWQKTLRCFEANELEWKTIREKSGEYRNQLEMELHECQEDFLLRKFSDYQHKLLSLCKIELESDRK
jgi:hypothetical protein